MNGRALSARHKYARFLLDTNICIYIRAETTGGGSRAVSTLETGEAVISVITYRELVYGAEKSQSLDEI